MASKREAATVKAMLVQARARYEQAESAEKDQREREMADLRFYAGDQWPQAVRDARGAQAGTAGSGSFAGLPGVPARPCLVINKVREPVRQVLNQERSSDIGIELVPADDFGDLGITPDDTEVTLREGLIRRIQRESEAADARTWAFSRSTIAGRGYYMVMTRFLPGQSWDKEIYVHRIFNQATVRLDPAHEQPDGSDAEWGFPGGKWYPWEDYETNWPTAAKRAPFGGGADSEFVRWGTDIPNWVDATEDARAVYVVDYFYIVKTARTLALLLDGSAAWLDDLPKDTETVDTRDVVESAVKWCKLDGFSDEPLEETDWEGPDIPIIKVLGEELHPYDKERRAEGMIRPARGPQEGLNAMVSKEVEAIALDPPSPPVVDPVAIEGYEQWYQLATTRHLPFMPARTYDDQGRQLPPPTRLPPASNIMAIANAIQMFTDGIENATSGAAPNRLRVGQSVQSNAAIQSLQQEEQFSTSDKLDNLARSIRWEAQITNNLLYPIYGKTPGRMVRVLTGEGEKQTMVIRDPAQQQQQQGQRQQAAKVGKLTKDAHFNIIIKIEKSEGRRLAQQADELGQLISANPLLFAMFGDLYLKARGGPGAKGMADRAKVMLAPPIQKMLAAQDEGQAPLPPEVEAKMAQMQEQLQAADQAIQQLSGEADGKKLDAQTKVQIETMKAQAGMEQAQLEAERDLRLQQMKDATTIRVAEIAAEAKGIANDHAASHEALALGQAQQHEAALEATEDEHEIYMAQMGQAQALEQGQQGADLGAEASAQGHQQNLETGQQAADLAPVPQEPVE